MQLTEQMILSRSRERNLASIQKLNIWGCDLTDVSILERLPNLEEVVLSENQISSLKQFQHCFRLKELYLHSNDIQNVDELIYLKNLPLKRLVLADNPCCRKCGDNYRVSVLKMLPFLECLDNQNIMPYELDMAMNMRVQERNLEAQNASQLLGGSPSPTHRAQQIIENRHAYAENNRLQPNECQQRYAQQPDARYGSLPTVSHARARQIYTQIGPQSHVSQTRQFGAEDNASPESQANKSKSNRYANYRNSLMDLSEWKKLTQAQENHLKSNSISPNSRPGYHTERPTYHSNDEFTSDYGYASPSSNMPRMGHNISADAMSVDSSRNSSIVSSNQGKITYPRSRRVNLLCASLRFILELDALSLVDLLSSIRERIEELRSI